MKKNGSVLGGYGSFSEKKWRWSEVSIFLSPVTLNGWCRRLNLSLVCVSSPMLTITMAQSCTASLTFPHRSCCIYVTPWLTAALRPLTPSLHPPLVCLPPGLALFPPHSRLFTQIQRVDFPFLPGSFTPIRWCQTFYVCVSTLVCLHSHIHRHTTE